MTEFYRGYRALNHGCKYIVFVGSFIAAMALGVFLGYTLGYDYGYDRAFKFYGLGQSLSQIDGGPK